MIFETETDFRYWLKVNGYMADSIEEIAYKWDSISIINGQITDSVTQNTNSEEPNIETNNEVSNIEN
jgi:hypothetical protein